MDLEITFNYIYPTIDFIEKTKNSKNSVYYDMKKFCNWLIKYAYAKKRPEIDVDLPNGEKADIEWKDSKYDQNEKLYYFRLKRLRSNNIPARTYINVDSTKITLKKNEYLGEFNLIIFDPEKKRLIVQRNSFGLSLGQIAKTLTKMRISRYKDIKKEYNKKDPGTVNLNLLLDKDKVENVKNNKIFRSYELRLADIRAIDLKKLGNNDILHKTVEMVDQVQGVSVSVKVSLARESKEKSLENNTIKKLIDFVQKINNRKKANLLLKARKSVNDQIDEIDVLVPKLMSTIKLEGTNRSTIGAEYVYHNFIDQNYERSNCYNGSYSMREIAAISGI